MFQRVAYHAPRWAASLQAPSEKIKLACLPTPIYKWNIPGVPEGFEIFIKARKLEFLLAEAMRLGADTVVTIGGVQSNHCRSTAAAARSLGLNTMLILRAPYADRDPGLVGNLLVSRLMGAELRMVTKEQYAEYGSTRLLELAAAELIQQGRKPYIIPVGGSNGLGTWGYIEMVRELQDQLQEMDVEISDIAMACGSGGTTAGIGAGMQLSGYPARCHGYMVCDNARYFSQHADTVIFPGMAGSGDGAAALSPAAELITFHDAKGAGYAMASDADMRTIRDVARSTGVCLDPVYAGKAVALMLRQMREAPGLFRGRKVLFVQTGGLLGLFDKETQLKRTLGIGSDRAVAGGAAADEEEADAELPFSSCRPLI